MKFSISLVFFILLVFTSCNNINKKNSINKSINNNKKISKSKKANKKLKDIALAKGEVILKDGEMKQILSKLDIYMSQIPKAQVEIIKSLKLENFRSLYFIFNTDKFYLKINGLDILKIIDTINKYDKKEKQKYKEYKNLKYFIKDKFIIATNGKNSFITSNNITIKDISKDYNMKMHKNLIKLIKENPNNGFYISFIKDIIKGKLNKNLPPFFKSINGISLFNYKSNGFNKLKFLVKLNKKDAITASNQLKVMYNAYLPMILQQVKGYQKLLMSKKGISQSEKDAYKKIINEFIDIVKNIEIKTLNDSFFITINLKSLESSVVIMGISIAVAIPAYIRYNQISRVAKVKLNFINAETTIKNELTKGKQGDKLITNDVVKKLNYGNKRSPTNIEHPAFEEGSKPVPYGTIVISKTNLRDVKTGETITIYPPQYNKRINFKLDSVTFTKK